MRPSRSICPWHAVVAVLLVLAAPAAAWAGADVVELWGQVQAPAPPELKRVQLDPAKTALLVLDMEEATCNMERRPRCVESLPAVAGLLARAREAGARVAHSQTSRATPFLPGVEPRQGEPVVKSSVDKFFRTDLERILADWGVDTVIVVGTAAHGAVVHTATGASVRGLKVVAPVDGLSAEDLYTEQMAVQHLLTGPGTRRNITLTTTDGISFRP